MIADLLLLVVLLLCHSDALSLSLCLRRLVTLTKLSKLTEIMVALALPCIMRSVTAAHPGTLDTHSLISTLGLENSKSVEQEIQPNVQ